MQTLTAIETDRVAGRLAGLRSWLRQRREAREARRLAQRREARASIHRGFLDWLEAADRLQQLAAEGWTDPGYAKALICEKAYYRELMSHHAQLRREALPL